MLSDERLAEIERRLWVVTPGPKHDHDEDFYGMCKDDAIFCANAYTDVADLVAEVRRLKEIVRLLRPALGDEDLMLARWSRLQALVEDGGSDASK